VDSTDRSIGRLCDGVILTEYQSVAGRYYMPWVDGEHAHGSDWDQYLDSLTVPGGILARLDSAAARVGAPVVWFTVMVPYPDSVQKAFQYDGVTWDLTVPSNRADVVERHVRRLVNRVTSLRVPRLQFAGFYWLNESARPADVPLIERVIRFAASLHYRVQWIPSWKAAGAREWASFGFKAADVWQQPNYFFHPEIGPARIDSAFAFAQAVGTDVELELDRRLFGDPRFSDRLSPYLAAFEKTPDIRNRSIAIYEGAGALIQLSRSREAAHRALYRRLVSVLRPEVRL
jgi:hypothetical protein